VRRNHVIDGAHFPDATARATLPPETPKADPFPTGSPPKIIGLKRVDAKP
jgi:hypothetical protein